VIVEQTTAIQKLRKEVFQLRAERDALRRDAARLDWLDARTAFLAHQRQGGGLTLTLSQPPVDGVRPVPVGFTGATLREAIDAARAVQPTTSTEANA
jgi:hypothetical protein